MLLLTQKRPRSRAIERGGAALEGGRSRRGQGMTEYIIIVALVAIAAVGIVTTYGNDIRALFGASVDILGGQTSATPRTVTAGFQGQGTKNLRNFATGEGGM